MYSKDYKNGYDYAAGALLRGEETPHSLERFAMQRTAFDSGVVAALDRLIRAGIVIDDSTEIYSKRLDVWGKP